MRKDKVPTFRVLVTLLPKGRKKTKCLGKQFCHRIRSWTEAEYKLGVAKLESYFEGWTSTKLRVLDCSYPGHNSFQWNCYCRCTCSFHACWCILLRFCKDFGQHIRLRLQEKRLIYMHRKLCLQEPISKFQINREEKKTHLHFIHSSKLNETIVSYLYRKTALES